MADRYDRLLTSWAGQYIAQIGRSEDLRARFYRSTVNPAQLRFGRRAYDPQLRDRIQEVEEC